MAKTTKTLAAVLMTCLVAVSAFALRDVLSNWWNLPAKLAIKPRLEARWRALDVTRQSLEGRTALSDWSGAVFIGSGPLNAVLDQLQGYRLEFTGEDARLKGIALAVESVDVTPAVGHAEAEMIIAAHRGDLALRVRVVADVSVQGIESRPGVSSAFARVRLEPLEFEPSLEWRELRTATPAEWSRLLPDLAVALARPDLFDVRLPIDDTLRLKLGFDQTATKVVNKEFGGTLTYRASMPETIIEQRFALSVPLFRPDGVWLLGRLADDGQPSVGPSSLPASDKLPSIVNRLQAEVDAMTGAFGGSKDVVTAFLGRTLFTSAVERVASLPEANRVVTIQSVSRQGQLARADWKDDLLGGGGYYAELAGDESASARVQIGQLHADWHDGGLHFEVPAAVDGRSDIHFHFDPLIGGGAGTSVGIDGRGAGAIHAATSISVADIGGVKAVLLRVAVACDAIQAQALTDGTFKVDVGWIAVPKVGARFTVPIGGDALTPVSIIDSRPTFVELPKRDPRSEADPAKRQTMIDENPWAHFPPHRAVLMTAIPTEAYGDDSGFKSEYRLEIQPLVIGDKSEDLEEARRVFNAERETISKTFSEGLDEYARAAQTCSADTEMAVLLGPVEIGPNNEVVKFARNAWNDLTKGPGPNNDLRKLVESAADVVKAVTPVAKAEDKGHQFEVTIGPVQVNIPKIKLCCE